MKIALILLMLTCAGCASNKLQINVNCKETGVTVTQGDLSLCEKYR